MAELADALDLGSSAYGMGVQVSSPAPYEPLAQLAEHMTFNHGVRGSIPRWLTISRAGVAELADALDLGSSALGMGVQVSSPAPFLKKILRLCAGMAQW